LFFNEDAPLVEFITLSVKLNHVTVVPVAVIKIGSFKVARTEFCG
jgi:hypothetical protein